MKILTKKIKNKAQLSFKIDKKTGCWNWTMPSKPNGYGQISEWRNGKAYTWYAHRVMYIIFKGKIPKGLHLDHLCRNTKCVNPDHLEAVSPKENILRGVGVTAKNARKTHCKRGHKLSGKNLYLNNSKDGVQRQCITCINLSKEKFKIKRPHYWSERFGNLSKGKPLDLLKTRKSFRENLLKD